MDRTGERMYVYVNSNTHEYEITNIPTTYPIKHIGVYVGSFISYQARHDEYSIGKHRVFDKMNIDDIYGPNGNRPNFCFVCHKDDHWASKCPEKDKQDSTYLFVYANPHTHDIAIRSMLDQVKDMKFVGSLLSNCNDYNRYCLKTHQKREKQSVKPVQSTSVEMQTTEPPEPSTSVEIQTTEPLEPVPSTSVDIQTTEPQESETMDQSPESKPKEKKPKLKKQNCFVCKTDKHKKQKICPEIVIKDNKPKKRKSETVTGEEPKKKKRKMSK